MFRSGTRGGFPKFNSNRRPAKFLVILHYIDFQGKKRAKSSKFSPAARSGQEGLRKSLIMYITYIPVSRHRRKNLGGIIKLNPYYKKAPPPLHLVMFLSETKGTFLSGIPMILTSVHEKKHSTLALWTSPSVVVHHILAGETSTDFGCKSPSKLWKSFFG